jgi:hypothetical protein
MAKTTDEPPRKVVLFSGHMIDAPGREKPRFPPDKEPIAASAIAAALADLGVGPADLGVGPADLCICGGACGGDLLFSEAALARSARLALLIPFDEASFRSTSPTGARVFSRRRREPRSTFNPANWVRRQQAKTPTSATIVGCSTPPRASARTRSTSSAFGTARAATGRAARST